MNLCGLKRRMNFSSTNLTSLMFLHPWSLGVRLKWYIGGLCLVCNIAFWVPLCWTIIYTLVWIPLILLHHVTIFFVSLFRLPSVVWQEIYLKQVNCCLPIGSGILPDFYYKDLFFDGWMSCCFDFFHFSSWSMLENVPKPGGSNRVHAEYTSQTSLNMFLQNIQFPPKVYKRINKKRERIP